MIIWAIIQNCFKVLDLFQCKHNHYVKNVCIRSYSGPYSVRIRENTGQNKSEYEHFSRCERLVSDSKSPQSKLYESCSPNPAQRKGCTYVHFRNTIKFGNKSLRQVRARIWNSLLENIEWTLSLQNRYTNSKDFMKKWPGPPCKCKLCHRYMQN